MVTGAEAFSSADVHLGELFADYAVLALADSGVLAGRTLEQGVHQELAWVEAHGPARGARDGGRRDEPGRGRRPQPGLLAGTSRVARDTSQ